MSVTDLRLLKTIYNEYYNDYIHHFNSANKERKYKIYVPIDIPNLAKKLGMETEIFHQRLYTHLENEYQHGKKHLFLKKAGTNDNCINFPYLASIIANLKNKSGIDYLTD